MEEVILIAVVVIGYLLPSLVAASRNHNDGLAIAVLNILLGWTGLGWIIALLWSLTGNVPGKNKGRLR